MRTRYKRIFYENIFWRYAHNFPASDFTYLLFRDTLMYYDARVFELEDFNLKNPNGKINATCGLIEVVQLVNHQTCKLIACKFLGLAWRVLALFSCVSRKTNNLLFVNRRLRQSRKPMAVLLQQEFRQLRILRC